MTYVTHFNKEYFKFALPQRTRLGTEYALTEDSSDEVITSSINLMVHKDFEQIKNYLPSQALNILDIGCGLGFIDIALAKKYPEATIWLLDKTELKTDKINGFNKSYTFYNSLDATEQFLRDNGVTNKIIRLEASDDVLKKYNTKFDIIISLLSCGWHYPLSFYIQDINRSLSEKGVLILDIRHNTDQLVQASQHFVKLDTVINTNESKHTGGTIGDRHIFCKRI